jgi:surface antigen
MFKKLACLSLIAITLTGCLYGGPNQSAGHLIGAATGAVIGSQFGHGRGKLVGVALGTLAGAYIGGAVGQSMDERDRALAQNAMQDSLEHSPDNAIRGWRNPNNRHSGNFRVTRTVECPEDNMVCRDYVHTVIIDGRQEKVHGRACRDVRDPRATWMIQS